MNATIKDLNANYDPATGEVKRPLLFDIFLRGEYGVSREVYNEWPDEMQEEALRKFVQPLIRPAKHREFDPHQVVGGVHIMPYSDGGRLPKRRPRWQVIAMVCLLVVMMCLGAEWVHEWNVTP